MSNTTLHTIILRTCDCKVLVPLAMCPYSSLFKLNLDHWWMHYNIGQIWWILVPQSWVQVYSRCQALLLVGHIWKDIPLMDCFPSLICLVPQDLAEVYVLALRLDSRKRSGRGFYCGCTIKKMWNHPTFYISFQMKGFCCNFVEICAALASCLESLVYSPTRHLYLAHAQGDLSAIARRPASQMTLIFTRYE